MDTLPYLINSVNIIGWNNFRMFLAENKVISTAIVIALSKQLETLIAIFLSTFVYPLFSKYKEGDGLFNYELDFSGMKFTLGKFLEASLHFGIVIYTVFLSSKVMQYLIA